MNIAVEPVQKENETLPSMEDYREMDWIIEPFFNSSLNKHVGGLAISNIKYCENAEKMEKDQISAVISVCGDKLVMNVTVKHLWIVVSDHPREDISVFFPSTFTFIDQHIQEGNVLVHCQAGISRSSSIVIAYLIRKNKINFDASFQIVKDKRPHIFPNKGFTKQLKRFSEEIISKENNPPKSKSFFEKFFGGFCK